MRSAIQLPIERMQKGL